MKCVFAKFFIQRLTNVAANNQFFLRKKNKMKVSIEVWAMIFKYLRLIDLADVSSVCKEFYYVCQGMSFYNNKLKDSRQHFFDKDWLVKTYKKTIKRFCYGVYCDVITYVPIENIQMFKIELFCRLYYSVLPFRVWHHLLHKVTSER